MARAGQPSLVPLPPELEAHAAEIRALPRLAGGLDGMPFEIKVVEFSRLLAYQSGVFLDRVEAAEKAFREATTPDKLAEICLPLNAGVDPAAITIPPDLPFRLVTRNANLKPLQVAAGLPHPDTGLLPMVFLVGEGEPCLQIIEFKGRWYLRNGYHRLVGALRAGVDQVPALVIHGRSWEDVHEQLGQGWFFDPRRGELPALGQFREAWTGPLRNFEYVTEFSSRTESRPI